MNLRIDSTTPVRLLRSRKGSEGRRVFCTHEPGEIEDDPLVEEVKGLTDGHLVLSRKLAEQGHYPALDITKSLSRVGTRFFTSEEAQLIQRIRSLYTSLREEKELMAISGLREEVTEISMKLQQINEYLKYIENKDQIASNPIEELKAITRYIT